MLNDRRLQAHAADKRSVDAGRDDQIDARSINFRLLLKRALR